MKSPVAVEKGTKAVISSNFGAFVEWKFNNLQKESLRRNTLERVFQQPRLFSPIIDENPVKFSSTAQMRRRTRIIGIVALALLVVVIAIVGWSMYSFKHTSILTADQLQDIQTAMKGEMGKAIFMGVRPAGQATEGTGLNALLAPHEPQGEGLIAAYQHDPETFRRYAQLFDTAINAKRIADAVRHDRTALQLPIPSSAMRLQRSEALDAWGHTYCISELKTAIVVVSGGPEAASFSCSQQKTPAHEIASAARSIFQASTGEVVVVLKNGEVQGTPDARQE